MLHKSENIYQQSVVTKIYIGDIIFYGIYFIYFIAFVNGPIQFRVNQSSIRSIKYYIHIYNTDIMEFLEFVLE